jgi:N-acetyl-anhydromuramyl-L-alanine amidase AmpD
MAFGDFERLSPNRDAAAHERQGVHFHHSGLGFAETIDRMGDPASRVSYHCLIDADGTRCSLVPETEIAWHAGDTYAAPLSVPQVESALEWLGARWTPLGWGTNRMTDHRKASPGRKLDLNPAEWDRLMEAISGRFGRALPEKTFPC